MPLVVWITSKSPTELRIGEQRRLVPLQHVYSKCVRAALGKWLHGPDFDGISTSAEEWHNEVAAFHGQLISVV